MQSRDTVNGMRAHNGQESHAHPLLISLLNEGHPADLLGVTRVLSPHLFQEVVIDEVDQVHVPRQQLCQQGYRPLLERLWQDCVICIGEGVVDDVPRFPVVELLLVQQDPEQLDRRDTWMRVVELDLTFVRELGPVIGVLLFVARNDIAEGGRAEEVLLLQTKFFTAGCRVVGIEDTGDVLSRLPLGDGSKVVTRVE